MTKTYTLISSRSPVTVAAGCWTTSGEASGAGRLECPVGRPSGVVHGIRRHAGPCPCNRMVPNQVVDCFRAAVEAAQFPPYRLMGTRQLGHYARRSARTIRSGRRSIIHSRYTAGEGPGKLKYMHENPVRAGLVVQPCDWAFSSARHYEQGRSVGVPIRWVEYASCASGTPIAELSVPPTNLKAAGRGRGCRRRPG